MNRLSPLFFLALAVSFSRAHAVSPGQIDYFEDGTTAAWTGSGMVGNAACDDGRRCLRSDLGPFVLVNRNQWAGDYETTDIKGVSLRVRNVGPANMLANAGFEVPNAPNGGEYAGGGDGWTAFNHVFTVDEQTFGEPGAVGGDQVLKAFGFAAGVYQEFPASPGQAWKASVWALNDADDLMENAQRAAINIEWHGATGMISAEFGGAITADAVPDMWTRLKVSGVAPDGTTMARVVVLTVIPEGETGGGAPKFDEAYFAKVPDPDSMPPPPPLPLRVGVSNDPDGPGSDPRTCFVSQSPVFLDAADDFSFVELPISADALVHVSEEDVCTGKDTLQEVLLNGAELRILASSTVSWTAGPVDRRVEVDHIRAQSAIQTDWRWIATRTGAACPTPLFPAWEVRQLFQPALPVVLPPGLENFCEYRFPPELPVTPMAAQAVIDLVGNGLANAEPDILGVTPPATSAGRYIPQNTRNRRGPPPSLEDIMHKYHVDAFEFQAGRPGLRETARPLDPVMGNPAVRLAIIDTQPDNSYADADGASLHGVTLLKMANRLLCDWNAEPDSTCVAALSANAALTYRTCNDDFDNINPGPVATGGCEDADNGGYYGLIGTLATSIQDHVRQWTSEALNDHLVLNHSVAWNPVLGGNEPVADDRPLAAQAVMSALKDAVCRGALPVFAAGNRLNGPLDSSGPMLPAAWETLPTPGSAECVALLGDPAAVNVSMGPLVYSAGGVQSDNERLFNFRVDGEPRLVAYADHGATRPIDGDVSSRFATLTGSSVASLVVSAAATAVWHYRPELNASQVMGVLYDAGTAVGRTADYTWPGHAGIVKRVSVFGAVQAACEGPGESALCAPEPPEAAVLDPAAIAAELSSVLDPEAVDIMTLNNEIEPDECNGETVNFSMPPGPGQPCPHQQFFSALAQTGTGGQPCAQPCPSCTFINASPGTIYMEIDTQFRGTLSDLTLKCDSTTYAIRSDETFADGDRLRIDNVPEACEVSKVVALMYSLSGTSARGGSTGTGTSEVLSAISPLFRLVTELAEDTDADGVTDDMDNCTLLANADQTDTNGDLIGNACDPDIGSDTPGVEDCVVNFSDLGLMKQAFFSSPATSNWNPDADLSGPSGAPDDQVNFLDLGTLKTFFFSPPGPSAGGCN